MAKDEREIHRTINFGNEAGQLGGEQITFGPDEHEELEDFLDQREKTLEDGEETKDDILERLERLGAISGFGYVDPEDVEHQSPDLEVKRRTKDLGPEESGVGDTPAARRRRGSVPTPRSAPRPPKDKAQQKRKPAKVAKGGVPQNADVVQHDNTDEDEDEDE